jgi:Na+/proline symporter
MTIKKPLIIKVITLLVAIAALSLALSNNQSVFDLVIFAWSGLASAFAPLLLLLCFGHRPAQSATLLAVMSGLVTAIGWRLLEWHAVIYEGLPGITAGLLVFALAALVNKQSQAEAASH